MGRNKHSITLVESNDGVADTSVGDWETIISAFFLFVTAFFAVGVLGLDVLGCGGCFAGFGVDVTLCETDATRGGGLVFSTDFDFSAGLGEGLLTGETEINF